MMKQRIRRIRNLARCVTPIRLVNLLLIVVSARLSELFRHPIVWGKPFSLTIEPTNICNLLCPECPSGSGDLTRPLGSMEFDLFKRIIDAASSATFYLNLFFQGEPFINKHLIDMVKYARSKRMYVAISTNAHYLQNGMAEKIAASNLDRLIVSLDGVTEESYRAYRVGGTLEKVLGGLSHLRGALAEKRNERLEITLQFLVTRQNENEIPSLHKLAKSFGAAVALKTMQVTSLESAKHFLPTNEKYSRYTIDDNALRMKGRMRNACTRLWDRSVITWDGTVVPCCFDKDARFPLGDVKRESLDVIWKSEAYHDFRSRLLRNRTATPMCTNCTEGLRVYR